MTHPSESDDNRLKERADCVNDLINTSKILKSDEALESLNKLIEHYIKEQAYYATQIRKLRDAITYIERKKNA